MATTPAPPKQVLEQKAERISIKSPYKIVTQTISEWGKPDAEGRYKDPESREYTMVEPMPCVACGAKIPALQFPPEIMATRGDTARDRAKAKYQNAYLCPKCGGPAYRHQIIDESTPAPPD